MKEYSFVLCVEGGGLDPSPKLWQAVLHGAIPIIRKSSLEKAYRHLPVACVDAWEPDAINQERLQEWLCSIAVWHNADASRQEILYRLSLAYWWDYITSLA